MHYVKIALYVMTYFGTFKVMYITQKVSFISLGDKNRKNHFELWVWLHNASEGGTAASWLAI